MSCLPRGKLGRACPLARRIRPRDELRFVKIPLNLRHTCPGMRDPRQLKDFGLYISRETHSRFPSPESSMMIKPASWASSRSGTLLWRRLEATLGDGWQGRAYLSMTVRHGPVADFASLGGDPTQKRLSRQHLDYPTFSVPSPDGRRSLWWRLTFIPRDWAWQTVRKGVQVLLARHGGLLFQADGP